MADIDFNKPPSDEEYQKYLKESFDKFEYKDLKLPENPLTELRREVEKNKKNLPKLPAREQ